MKMQRVVMAFLFTFFVCGCRSATREGAIILRSRHNAFDLEPHNPRLPPTRSRARRIKNRQTVRSSGTTFSTRFGPYAILGSAVAAGINQASGDRINGTGSGTPPEWGGGTGPYFERFASNYGINITATTARYLMAEVFREDTIYYRCECTGFSHRSGSFSDVNSCDSPRRRRTLSFLGQ